MKINKNYFFLLFLLLSITQLMGCKDSESFSNGIPYDPSKPLELTSFYPDSGKYLEKVILTGSNFGTKPDSVKVYFNSKKAAVIGTRGDEMYALAPRLPGDTCTISVVIGKDSLTYAKTFRYQKSVTVTTIAGNGSNTAVVTGELGQTSLQPRYICCDKDGNVFVCNRGPNDESGTFCILRIDEENDELIMLTTTTGNVPCADPSTGIITIPTETAVGSYLSLDPKEFWAPRTRQMKWPDGYNIPALGYKHCMVVNPADGYIYTRYYYGDLIKINPITYEVTPLMKTQPGNSYGLTFSPLHPNLLYISFWDDANENANSICTVDVTDPTHTFQRISSPNISGGYRDGKISEAQFHDPSEIFCDNDGNIYVADYSNQCIRRITADNMVETTLGVPGQAGWQDGTKEEALFSNPRGIAINSDGAVYVADFGNCRIRKLTIN
jgi:streptogramin lyase